MMSPPRSLLVGLFLLAPVGLSAAGGTKPKAEKYTLRYQFHRGETLRWEVVHRSRTDTTVSRKTQAAETFTKSTKAWRVLDVGPDGTAVFEHMVEDVMMRQKMDGKDAVCYNSLTDKEAPLGYQQVAKSIGVPLVVVTMDGRGNVRNRLRRDPKDAKQGEGEITIRLPEKPVSVGETWSIPGEVNAGLATGGFKKIKMRHTYTLQSVRTGVATIEVATQILTPIDDPRIESQLIKHASTGTVRFDVDAGRVLSQQMDLDKQVVGFHTDASTVHYLTRLTEKLLPAVAKTASRSGGKRR